MTRIFIARDGGGAKVAGLTGAMESPFVQLIVRWLVLALGVTLAAKLVPGIACDDGFTLLAVVVVLSFCNAILKPVLVVFTLPFILLTLGLGMIVINALLFYFVGHIVSGFHVATFRSAVGGSIVVSLTNFCVSFFVRRSTPRPPDKPDDVIDV
jgi:putative membrane protein